MSADLYIHVLTDEFTEKHYKAFRSNTLGSKFFNPGFDKRFEKEHGIDLFMLCAETPNVWVGSVSWLKYALTEDDSFVPDPVDKISTIIGESFPVINDDLIQEIRDAMNIKNNSIYEITDSEKVIEFLELHKGKKAFTISW